MNIRRTIGLTIALLVLTIGVAVFLATGMQSLLYAPQDPEVRVPATSTATADLPPGSRPDRLMIPALNIDAVIEEVGVNGKGNMATPSKYADVAWYKFGTIPGETGSAVMAGHVDNGLALDGVFKHLEDLHVGDDLYVTMKTGERLHFKVSDIRSYPYDKVPTEELFNKNDVARLNLVTCVGSWLKSEKTYDERLIVYTILQDN